MSKISESGLIACRTGVLSVKEGRGAGPVCGAALGGGLVGDFAAGTVLFPIDLVGGSNH